MDLTSKYSEELYSAIASLKVSLTGIHVGNIEACVA